MNRFTLFFILFILFLSSAASADIPHLISLQGRLTDASNNPVTSATNFVFRIYNDSSGGTLAWNETQNSIVPDANGLFSVLLGSVKELNIPFSESYWLEVEVQGAGPTEILSPRQRLGSSPYSVRSENPWNASGDNIHNTNSGNVSIKGNILDSSGNIIYNNATKKIERARLPYQQGDITSDVDANMWDAGYYNKPFA